MEIRKLDDYSLLIPMADKNNNLSWWKFTFKNLIVNGTVTFDIEGTLWTMEEVDINTIDL